MPPIVPDGAARDVLAAFHVRRVVVNERNHALEG
jgi:hypothetical protein